MPKAFTPNDKFYYKAQEMWYRARSAFKLIELDDKFNFFKKWQSVLDLWAAPWSWLQVAKQRAVEWKIIWVDLKEIKRIKWVHTFVCDVFSNELWKIIKEKEWIVHFDITMSDMAPNTSWIPDVDQFKSVELNLQALEVMKSHLKTWWTWIFKVFRWEDFNDFWNEALKTFPRMKTFKPKSVRDRSTEIYCIWKKL